MQTTAPEIAAAFLELQLCRQSTQNCFDDVRCREGSLKLRNLSGVVLRDGQRRSALNQPTFG